MNYSRNSLHINFLDLSHHYDKRDSIMFDTGVNSIVNIKLNKLPPYTCGIYLTWNDRKLDYHLPQFIGCGEVVEGKTIQSMHNSKRDIIIFGSGELDINMNEALDNKYKNDSFLLLKSTCKYKNNLYQGKYVYWHLKESDIVFNQIEEVIEYLNYLPYKVKMIKHYNLPPSQ